MSDVVTAPKPRPEIPTAESYTDAELWLNNVANHPGKLVTLLILSGSSVALSKGQLFGEVCERVGGEPPFSEGTLFDYCRTMSKAGATRAVEATAVVSHYPRIVEGFEATEQGKKEGYALAGLLLDWQIRNPELPLQKLLGITSNKVKGAVHAPTLRMLAFSDLVERHQEQQGPSIDQLASAVDSKNSTKQAMVDTLTREGVFDFKSKKTENEREFTILDPEYIRKERQPRFDKLKPETQLIYKALGVAKKIRDEWKVDEFLRLAEALDSPVDPEVMNKVRSRLQHSLAPSTSGFKDAIQAKEGQVYSGQSLVKLKPEFLEPIRELVALFDGFAGGEPEVLQRGQKLAGELYDNPDALGWLLRYAFEISSKTENDPAKEQRILRIIEEKPGITSKEITHRYREVRGKKVGLSIVRNTLADSLKGYTPRAKVEVKRATPIKDTPVRTFHLKEKELTSRD